MGAKPTTEESSEKSTELPRGASGSALLSDWLGLEIINTEVRHQARHSPGCPARPMGVC